MRYNQDTDVFLGFHFLLSIQSKLQDTTEWKILNSTLKSESRFPLKREKTSCSPAFIRLYTYKKQLQLCIQVISFYINKMFLPFLVTEALKK